MKKSIEIYYIYTVPEAAEALGTSQATIITLIKNKTLKAIELGKGYKILGEHLLTFMRR